MTAETSSSLIQRQLLRLQAWFFAQGSPLPLALFRISMGLTLLVESTTNLKRVDLYTPQTFHLPYISWIEPLPLAQIATLFTTQRILAALLLLGLATRPVIVALIALQTYVFLICQLNFRNHIYLELLMLSLMLFSASGSTWSLDAQIKKLFWRWRKQPSRGLVPHWVPLMPQRLIALQVSVVYFYAALHKMTPGFLSGYPLGLALSRAVPRSRAAQALLDPPALEALGLALADPAWSSLISILTVAAEGFLALGLLSKATRPAAIIVGVGLHLGIALGMDIYTFGMVMISAYFCTWTPRQRPLHLETSP